MPEKKDLNVSTFLYSSWRSSCSYRVRICLNLKQIPFKIMPIDLMSLTKSSDNKDYNLNPMQFLPSLVIDGHTLIESMVMMEYLDETRPQPWLLPRDSFQRAQVRTICEIIISGIQPLQNTGVLNYIGDIFGKKEEAWAKYWITKGFTALEKLLTHCAGRYCVGDEITLADCCLVPQVFNARRYGTLDDMKLLSFFNFLDFILTLNLTQISCA